MSVTEGGVSVTEGAWLLRREGSVGYVRYNGEGGGRCRLPLSVGEDRAVNIKSARGRLRGHKAPQEIRQSLKSRGALV